MQAARAIAAERPLLDDEAPGRGSTRLSYKIAIRLRTRCLAGLEVVLKQLKRWNSE